MKNQKNPPRMNKSDLIYRITTRARDTLLQNYKQELIRDVVNVAVETLLDKLALHEKIELRGFGSFSVRTYEGNRYIRNPNTGQVKYAKREPRVWFRAAMELKKAVDVYGRKG